MGYQGHCTCGAVKYELSSRALFVHACHCSYCQRETGSAFVLNALIERDRLHISQGETREVLTPSESGKGQRIVRCAQCDVALYSHYAYGKLHDAVAFVRVGTLVDKSAFAPDVHIFTKSKQPWLDLGDAVPVLETFYRASELWPKESLERRAALLDTVG